MRFTIRDLLWLTVVVAMGLAWWEERRNTKRRIEAIRHWAANVAMPHDYPRELYEDLSPEMALETLPNLSSPAPNPPSE